MTSRVLNLLSFDAAEEIARELKLDGMQEELCAKIVLRHLQKLPEKLQKNIDGVVIGTEAACAPK
jgi:hypothetical protein